ncbi:hypothetical protein TELCIR_10698 [Teladorsagia circumcincta]|uniref:Uncharacterized protein n=1 Tax=Teladorsagia circumcincta TaxID=45464 RepID=A0A2G9UBH9_TELCI|nr:hypothetical protein TELCIR_10698 [Teladorsagia circumcincta]
MNKSIKKMMHDARQRFGHAKHFYCNPCDSRLGGSKAVCVNPECAIQGIPPKRCKAMKRTAIHFLNIEPQLALILDKNLSTLVQLHRDIHCGEFHRIIATTRNYTYADKFILGLEDFSCTTGSEKDALSFVVFPLAAAMNICADPVGGVAVLAYWILVRAIERSSELSINDFGGIQELARGMKYLCTECGRGKWRPPGHKSSSLCFVRYTSL